MQSASLGRFSHVALAARPVASAHSHAELLQDCFASMDTPEFLPKAMDALKTLSQSGDHGTRQRGQVALAAVVAASTGPLALALCRTTLESIEEEGLKLASFARRLAEPLDTEVSVVGAIARAVMPHYGMAPGSMHVVDDLHLFLGPTHAQARSDVRVACLKARLEQLGNFDDDHAYASYLHSAAREGAGGGQMAEFGHRLMVGGVLVKRRT